jgi:hypothetical protein
MANRVDDTGEVQIINPPRPRLDDTGEVQIINPLVSRREDTGEVHMRKPGTEERTDEVSSPFLPGDAVEPTPGVAFEHGHEHEIEIDVGDSPAPAASAPVAPPRPVEPPANPLRGRVVLGAIKPVSKPASEVSPLGDLTAALEKARMLPPLENPDPAAAALPVLPPLGAPEPPATGLAPIVPKPSNAALDIDSMIADLAEPNIAALAPAEPPLAPVELAAALEPEAAAAALASGETMVFAPPDAPPLVVSGHEPAAVPTASIAGLSQDGATLSTLRKLTGAQPGAERARAALHAALRGDAYDRNDIPDGRTIALGIARLLVLRGCPPEHLVDAVVALLDE